MSRSQTQQISLPPSLSSATLMATPPLPTRPNTISTFHKVVCLHDWWLTIAENASNRKVLGVGGFTSKGTTRIFSSAPIVKRYDMFTLQTADGITVLIKGYINKTRTHDNGISLEVCDHFLIGFPFNWEEFNHHCEEVPISTSQSDDCGNLNDGESRGKSSGNNSKDPSANSVLETSAEVSDPSDIELHKSKNIPKENEADVETPKTSKNNRDRSTESIFNIGYTLKDQTALRFSIGSGGRSSPYLSSIEKVKYLSNRIQAICGSKRKRASICDSGNRDHVNNRDTPTRKKSCLVTNSITSSVDHFDSPRRIILTSPNGASRESANNDTAEHDASKDCSTQPGSCISTVNPSVVKKPVTHSETLSAKDAAVNPEKENLTNGTPSKVSVDKISCDSEPSGPVGVRRSGRLRSVKKTTF